MHEVERDAAVPNIDGYFATGAFDSTPREDTHNFLPDRVPVIHSLSANFEALSRACALRSLQPS